MSARNAGFFEKNKLFCPSKLTIPAHCNFRALAFSLVDHFLNESQKHIKPLSELFKYHAKFFNLPKFTYPVAPHNILNFYKNAPGELGRFIAELSFTLRQLVEDEWYKNPAQYLAVFIKPLSVRAPENLINFDAIQALSNIFKLSITLSMNYSHKELPCRLVYIPTNGQQFVNQLCLKVVDNIYIPLLKNIQTLYLLIYHKKQDIYIKQRVQFNEIEFRERHLANKLTLKQMKLSYQKMIRDLTLQFTGGVLSVNNLISLYCELHNENLSGVLNYKTQQRFNSLFMVANLTIESSCNSLADEIIQAIARIKVMTRLSACVNQADKNPDPPYLRLAKNLSLSL